MIPLSKIKAKYIKSLQLKKNRDKEKRFIVEGKKSVLEFINSKFRLITIIGTREFYEENSINESSTERLIAKTDDLSTIGALKSNNAVLGVFAKPEEALLSSDTAGLILALDGINNPGNLGTIIRTADWFGIKSILLNEDSVDPFNPKVISASMGSMSRVDVYSQPLSAFLATYTGEVLAADMTGTAINQLESVKSGVIIMGSESHGVNKALDQFITQRVTIPALGPAESLNVGVATGIICYMLTRVN
jgi:TrmH family RNA methyltransferase